MLITGKCKYEGCQDDITPAHTQVQFNRNLGLHLRLRHGVRGATSTPEGRRQKSKERYARMRGLPLPVPEAVPVALTKTVDNTRDEIARAERRKKYQANYRRMMKLKKAGQPPNNSTIDREAILKFICPDCGCRIWTTKPMS